MATNLLSLPLLAITVETATNESWRDSVAFVTAGSIAAYPSPGNTGLGIPTSLAVQPGAYIGNYTITFSDPNTYLVTDPDSYVVGAGTVYGPFSAGGISFSLTSQLVPFTAGDSITLTVLPQALDISGIRFVMQMRTSALSPQVLLQADTADGSLVSGGSTGVLGLNISQSVMAQLPPSAAGNPYVFDYLAIADGDQRRCISGTNNVVPGITSPASQ